MIIPTNPRKLNGNWKDGYFLDRHIVRSVCTGENEYGQLKFDSERSQLGEAVFQLKYRFDKSKIVDISETVSDFIKNKWSISNQLDYILPVPPSKIRAMQPVNEIAKKVGMELKIPVSETDIGKVKITSQLKDLNNYADKVEILKDSFEAKTENLIGKTILVLDDLYSSGATLNVLTDVLYNKSQVKVIYILALTRTK
jgi:competence protein ComFC